MLDLGAATIDHFSPHVGTPFVLNHPELDETFTLVQADLLRAYDQPAPQRDPFTLFFNGSRTDIQFDQQILPLTHATIGDMMLFLVPVSRNADGTIRYQAVFS